MKDLLEVYKNVGAVRVAFVEIPLSTKLNAFFWDFIFPVDMEDHLQRVVEDRLERARNGKSSNFFVSLYYDASGVVKATGYCADYPKIFEPARQFYTRLGVPEEFLKDSLDYGLSVMKRFGALKDHSMKGGKIAYYTPGGYKEHEETYRYFHMNVDGGVDTKWMWYLANGDYIYYTGEGARKVAERIGHNKIRHISLLDMTTSFLEAAE